MGGDILGFDLLTAELLFSAGFNCGCYCSFKCLYLHLTFPPPSPSFPPRIRLQSWPPAKHFKNLYRYTPSPTQRCAPAPHHLHTPFPPLSPRNSSSTSRRRAGAGAAAARVCSAASHTRCHARAGWSSSFCRKLPRHSTPHWQSTYTSRMK